MALGRKAAYSIVELERLLNEKRSALAKHQKHRADLLQKLDQVEREIQRLGGSITSRAPRGRARNGVSLVEAMAAVLKGKPPMKVGDILEGVLANGYHSTSANFRGIVNQTLIKEKQFQQVGRGTYTVK